MPEIDTTDIKGINKLFAGLVFRMLLEEGMISEELVENMNSWKHIGFGVYCAEPIEACDANGRKTLSEYISRAPFSLERMSFFTGRSWNCGKPTFLLLYKKDTQFGKRDNHADCTYDVAGVRAFFCF